MPISTANENSESGGSRQVSPRDQIYSPPSAGNETISPNSLNQQNDLDNSKPGNDDKATFTISSRDSISNDVDSVAPTKRPVTFAPQRSRSASDLLIPPPSGNLSNETSSPLSTEDLDNAMKKPPFPDGGIETIPDVGMSRETLQEPVQEKLPLHYSKSIPSSVSKQGFKKRQSHIPGSTIGALALSIHKPSKHSKLRRRLVFKNGDSNISATNVHKIGQRYLADIFTTLVDMQWRWTILLFGSSFFVSWVFFAAIWWLIAYLHDDLSDKAPHGYSGLVSWPFII